jgi:hypothetical protein
MNPDFLSPAILLHSITNNTTFIEANVKVESNVVSSLAALEVYSEPGKKATNDELREFQTESDSKDFTDILKLSYWFNRNLYLLLFFLSLTYRNSYIHYSLYSLYSMQPFQG